MHEGQTYRENNALFTRERRAGEQLQKPYGQQPADDLDSPNLRWNNQIGPNFGARYHNPYQSASQHGIPTENGQEIDTYDMKAQYGSLQMSNHSSLSNRSLDGSSHSQSSHGRRRRRLDGNYRMTDPDSMFPGIQSTIESGISNSAVVHRNGSMRSGKDSTMLDADASVTTRSESDSAKDMMVFQHVNQAAMPHTNSYPMAPQQWKTKTSHHDAVETPREKSAYREFNERFKKKEKESYEAALEYALDSVNIMPDAIKWRVYVDLGDISRKYNQLEDARSYYRIASQASPCSATAWIERSKLEEECGNLQNSLAILTMGLQSCGYNESLLTRAIRHLEKMHLLKDARSMLSSLQHEPIEKS